MTKTYVSARAFGSQRKSGFKNTSYALAELVDNAFDAEADEVRIIFVEKHKNGRPRVDQIIIADNGAGMSRDLLEDCLILGESGVTEMEEILKTKRIGKFGYGLPNASLSQCQLTEVYSWEKNNDTYYQSLDLPKIKDSQSIEVPEAIKKAIPPHISLMINDKSDSGTVVVWSECDLISYSRAKTLITHSEKVLGRIYRYLIHKKQKKIILSWFSYSESNRKYTPQETEITVRPEDPLFLMEDTTISQALYKASNSGEISAPFYKPFSINEKQHKPTSYKLDGFCDEKTFKYLDKTYKYFITTSVSYKDIQKPGLRNGGDTSIGELYRQKELLGNIYFVRADREVDVGSFGDFYRRAQANHRFWTIEIKFEPDMDDLFGVLNNKQHVGFQKTEVKEPYDENYASPVEAQNALFYQLSDQITAAWKAAYSKINKQAEEYDVVNKDPKKGPKIPVNTPTTTTTVIKTQGKRAETLPQAEKDRLIKKLEEKYPKLEREAIEQSIINLDQSTSRAAVIYVPSDSEQLWNYTKIWDFHIIEVNINHSFYIKVISPLQEFKDDASLTAIELFIIAYVIEEENNIQNDQKKRAIESHRLALAIKLKQFMDELSESFNVTSVPQVYDIPEDDY